MHLKQLKGARIRSALTACRDYGFMERIGKKELKILVENNSGNLFKFYYLFNLLENNSGIKLL